MRSTPTRPSAQKRASSVEPTLQSDDEQVVIGTNNDEDDDYNVSDDDNDKIESETGDEYAEDDESIGPKQHASHSQTTTPRKQRRTRDGDHRDAKFFRTRGIKRRTYRGSIDDSRIITFGPDEKDQAPALQALYKWKHEPCTPSKIATGGGFGGFHLGFYRTERQRLHEAEHDWAWYDNPDIANDVPSGRVLFNQGQVVHLWDSATAQPYIARAGPRVDYLAGPHSQLLPHSLPAGESRHLDDHFRSVTDQPDADHALPVQSVRRGWLLNMGHEVDCLAWVPNQPGNDQFLAVTISSTDTQPSPAVSAAFTPLVGKSCIYIWHFVMSEDRTISSRHKPNLCQAICTDWGLVKSLAWCPAVRFHQNSGNVHQLGLLASVWGDGTLRVLDIKVDISADNTMRYVYCASSAFTAVLPHTIFTSVTWLSASALVAGSADGRISVWHIYSHLTSKQSSPAPILSIEVQSTYIVNVTPCYPSRPNIVLASSMAGQLSMTDLNEISAARTCSPTHTVPSVRSRIGKSVLAWHDFAQSAMTIDDTCTLQALPVRRFYSLTGLSQLQSPAMHIVTSPVHPFVLIGTVSGNVFCTNPMMRLMQQKVPIWHQLWFSHEWCSRPIANTAILHTDTQATFTERSTAVVKAVNNNSSDVEDKTNGDDTAGEIDIDSAPLFLPQKRDRQGMVRMLDGYKAECVKLDRNDGTHFSATTTVHEHESAITALAWNPNICAGGWCAAGMASGLLRVEDIARDEAKLSKQRA